MFRFFLIVLFIVCSHDALSCNIFEYNYLKCTNYKLDKFTCIENSPVSVINSNIFDSSSKFNKAETELHETDNYTNIDTNTNNISLDNILQRPKISQLFEIFIKSQEKLVNSPMIAFSVGTSQNKLPTNMQSKKLGITNSFSLEYGFVRLDSADIFTKLLQYSSEYAFIELNTNKFGILYDVIDDLYDNEFAFGVGMRTGMGYSFSNSKNINCYLLHSSAFSWTYFDYANYEMLAFNNPKMLSFFNAFDENYKFGWKGAATISITSGANLNIDLSYEHNNIFSGFEFSKWGGSWLIDNILQRWIDILDPVFIEELQYNYPLFKFIYKNAVSIILSEFRHKQQYYPFRSSYSLLQRRGVLQIRLIF